MSKTLIVSDLDQFVGSDELYTTPLYRPMQYTEGARYVANAGEAWWLLDAIIFSAKHVRRVREEPFQVWTLTVKDARGWLSCTDGDNETPLYRQRIPLTDFPLSTITLWLVSNVLMLPSEY